jgi:Cytochrome c7 and related cytochrome c
MLEPVRTSLSENKPLAWTRVHDLPDFVYFNHSIHVQKGVGCVSCHGRVDKMPLAWKEEPMTMEWCLECHRHPERHLRDKSDVFRMDLVLTTQEQLQKGREHMTSHRIELDRLTNCSVCHR